MAETKASFHFYLIQEERKLTFGGNIIALNAAFTQREASSLRVLVSSVCVFYYCGLTRAGRSRPALRSCLSFFPNRELTDGAQLQLKKPQRPRKSSGSPAYVQMRAHAALIKSRLQPVKCAESHFRLCHCYLSVREEPSCWGSLQEYHPHRAEPRSSQSPLS